MSISSIDKPKVYEEGHTHLDYVRMETGQTLIVFEAPQDMVLGMNTLYDKLVSEKLLYNMNNRLLGKISNEHSVFQSSKFYRDDDTEEVENHNFIPDNILEWIKERIHDYLHILRISYIGIQPNSAWINEMEAGEYNPVHNHNGGTGICKSPLDKMPHKIGLIGLMGLKIPEDMGEENTRKDNPRNGFTEFFGGGRDRQFAPFSTLLKLHAGMFIVHPYDVAHTVYPHFNKNETRRTFATNIDVYL
tara:strand:- start:254 stop:991 length:738 start_codon:yes stop_codon:yes gene_type:complete